MGKLLVILFLFGQFFSEETLQEKLNQLFKESKKFEVAILLHGGYGTEIMGVTRLKLKKISARTYQCKYKDFEGKKINSTLKKQQVEELREILHKMLDVHEKGKKLNGNCSIFDRNVLVKNKKEKVYIKPRTNAHLQQLALEGWIEDYILKKPTPRT